MLRLTLFIMMTVPAYLVLAPVGASGSLQQLLALVLLGLWIVAAGFGGFRHRDFRHPGRVALMIWLTVALLSYATMMGGLSGSSTVPERAAADRWLLLLLAGAGLTLSVTQSLLTREDVRRAVGWLLAGASVCGVVAMVQFTTQANPMDLLQPFMMGFEDNGSGTPTQPRGAFLRVAGTTMHPIELGVVCSMLLPLSIWWGLYSTCERAWRRWAPSVLMLACCAFTVSRSAMLGLAVTAAVMIPHLPRAARQWSLIVAPTVLVSLFVAVPGMMSTLFGAATAGTDDPSISARTDDYPLAWKLLVERPVLGHGPGTWMPENAMDIFDNEYLMAAVTQGVLGVGALLIYLLVPAMASLLAAKHAQDAELRLLCGSVAAAMFVAFIASATFDSMSFMTFALLVPFFVGLSGTAWLLVTKHLTTLSSADRLLETRNNTSTP
ncbi:hypothetical protein GCM10025784_03890 [Citricoccus nitrophenolicus]